MNKKLLSLEIALLITKALLTEYISLPYKIEGEDLEGVDQIWTSVYNYEIKGSYSGNGFVYLQDQPFFLVLM